MDENAAIRSLGRRWAEQKFQLKALAHKRTRQIGKKAGWHFDWWEWDGTAVKVLDPEGPPWPREDLNGKPMPTLDELGVALDDLGAKDDAARLAFAERINAEARLRYLDLVYAWERRRKRIKGVKTSAIWLSGAGAAWYFGGSWTYAALAYFGFSVFFLFASLEKTLSLLRWELYQLRRHVDAKAPRLGDYFEQSDDWLHGGSAEPSRRFLEVLTYRGRHRVLEGARAGKR
jgi:hypothetical protein